MILAVPALLCLRPPMAVRHLEVAEDPREYELVLLCFGGRIQLALGVVLMLLSLGRWHLSLDCRFGLLAKLNVADVGIGCVGVRIRILHVVPQTLSGSHDLSELLKVLDVALSDVADHTAVLFLVILGTIRPFVHLDCVAAQMD